MRRLVAVTLVAATLALSGCGSGTADYPAPHLVTAGTGTGNLFAHGTVTSAGKPVAGAKVVLQAAPAGATAEPGAAVKRWSAPAVTTGDDGSWALHLDAATIPAAYFPHSHSYLEFDLVFGDGSRLSVWSGTLYLRDDPDVWRTEGAGPRAGVLTVDADLDSGDLTALDSLGKPLTSGE